MIIKPDPHLARYVFEKQQNPDRKLWWLAVKRRDLEDVDRLVEISHGNRESIKTSQDWQVLDELLKFFAYRWPTEFKDFIEAMPKIKESRNPGGYSKNKEMMYLAALPPRLEGLIKTLFPLQEFNKDFMYKLIRKYRIFRVGGKNS